MVTCEKSRRISIAFLSARPTGRIIRIHTHVNAAHAPSLADGRICSIAIGSLLCSLLQVKDAEFSSSSPLCSSSVFTGFRAAQAVR